MIDGNMGTDPLNGNDATAVLGMVTKWAGATSGPAVAELVKTLRAAGYTSVPEKDTVPAWARDLPAKMPAEVYGGTTDDGVRIPGLYDLMLAHPDKLGDISTRLIEQYGDERGMSLYEKAERDAMRDMRIDAARTDLYNAIHEIRQQALKAAARIAALKDLYDVEVTEGRDMPYVESFIDDIRKAGIAAYAILPFDENGDVK